MRNWVTNSGYEIYQVLSGRCNSFVIFNGRGKYILVDTGRTNAWGSLHLTLDRLCSRDNKLETLILTHTHFDHAENAARLQERYGVKIIVQRNEADYIRKGDSPLPRGTNFATRWLTDTFGSRVQPRYRYNSAEPGMVVEDYFDLNPMGFRAYIIHTPGHSPGSVSVVVDDEIAIVGDAMFGVFKGSVFPPFAEDPEVMIESWKRLLDTGCSLFLPAHGTENGRELLKKEYDKRIWR